MKYILTNISMTTISIAIPGVGNIFLRKGTSVEILEEFYNIHKRYIDNAGQSGIKIEKIGEEIPPPVQKPIVSSGPIIVEEEEVIHDTSPVITEETETPIEAPRRRGRKKAES